MRRPSILAAAPALVLLSACAFSNDVEGLAGGAGECIGCHGGANGDTSGAPPVDAEGLTSSDAVGAHTAHLSAAVACNSCHEVPGQGPAPLHDDRHADVIFGAVAQDPDGLASAAYDATSHTCANVYCHAPSTAPGGTTPPPWNAPVGTLTGCGACHAADPHGDPHGGTVAVTQCTICHSTSVDGTGAVIPRPAGTHADGSIEKFTHPAGWATPHANGTTDHGLAAIYRNKARYPTGFEGCKRCHGSTLDNPIALNVPTCDGCHTGAATWRTSCTFCHGDPARANVTARPAPPIDADGATTSAHVGAHQAHLVGDQTNTPVLTDGVACGDCHGPTNGTSPTLPSDHVHADGTTEVKLKQPGQDGATGSYDPATGTCANTYCHGNLPRNAKAGNTPSWTATTGQSRCDACHEGNGLFCTSRLVASCPDVRTGAHELHRCSRCHGEGGGPRARPARAAGECIACHDGFQRGLDGATGYPDATLAPAVNRATHVDGSVEVRSSVTIDGTTFSITYTSPSGSSGASCSTSCHGPHGVPASQSW